MIRPVRTRLVVILVVVMATAGGPRAAGATMYECGGTAGPWVFTDSPAQLKNCVPLGGTSPVAPAPAPPFPMAPSATVMPPESGYPVNMDRPPSYLPDPTIPPPGTPPVADRNIGPPAPHEPVAAATPETTGAQRCASPINPFNPLMAIPCPPSEPHSQQTSEPEGVPAPPPPPETAPPPVVP